MEATSSNGFAKNCPQSTPVHPNKSPKPFDACALTTLPELPVTVESYGKNTFTAPFSTMLCRTPVLRTIRLPTAKSSLRSLHWLWTDMPCLNNCVRSANWHCAWAKSTDPEQHVQLQISAAQAQLLLAAHDFWHKLQAGDVALGLRQKGVDMRIAIDIASLTLKQQVSTIVLVAGDSDFVPAAKLARREGMEFILDPLWQNVNDDLFEHIDALQSGLKRPVRAPDADTSSELEMPN